MTLAADRVAGIETVSCTEQTESKWDAFVSEHGEASVFHRFGWKHVFENVYGNECVYLAARERGTIIGILPLVFKKSFLFGKFLTSLPYFDHVGICSDREEVRRTLLMHSQRVAEEKGAKYIELRHDREHALNLLTKRPKVSMTLELPPDPEHLWSDLKAKVRNQVRKAEKEGLSVREGGKELAGDFFEIYVANMRDLGSPGHTKKFFNAICNVFPEEVRIFTVAFEGKPVASGLTIASKDTLAIPWASSLREFNSKCPNMLLYWNILKYGCESGFSCFSFGRSTPDEGTYRFKKQWGAQPGQLFWQYHLMDGHEAPSLGMDDTKYQLPIRIWKSMPVAVTRRLGPKLIRSLA